MPLICPACEVFISTATRNTARACASEVGQKLLRCAEAFAGRDYQGRPVDSLGKWHQGVAMQRTRRWEPWCGTTAQATETAVAEYTGQPEKQLHQIYERYCVSLQSLHKKSRAAQPDGKSKRRRISTIIPATNNLSATAPPNNHSMPLRFIQSNADAAQLGPPRVTTTMGPSLAQPGPSRTLQHLCTNYQITAFQRPFYLLMIMKLLPVQWGGDA